MRHFQTGIPDGTYPLQLGGIADSASRDHSQPCVEKFLWLLGQHWNTKLASIQPFLFSWPEKEVLTLCHHKAGRDAVHTGKVCPLDS